MLSTLKELTNIFSKENVGKIQIFNPYDFDENLKNKTKIELFNSIRLKKVTEENEIVALLGFKSKRDKGYLMSLGRFRDELLNLFVFLDPEKAFTNKFSRDYAKAIKHLMIAKLMMIAGVKNLALSQLQKTILLSRKNKFAFEMESAMLEYIRIGTRTGKGSYLNIYIGEYESVQKWANDLKTVEFILSKVFTLMNNRKTQNKEERKVFKEYLKSINKIENPFNDIRIDESKFLANAYSLQANSEFKELIKVCNEYSNKIQNNPNSRVKHTIGCVRFLLIGYLHTKSFEKSQILYEKHIGLYKKNSTSYIHFHELFFLICMHTNQYQRASQILYEVYDNKALIQIPSIAQERWHLYEPFLLFSLYSTDQKSTLLYKINKKKYDLKVKSSMKDLPIYSKDKEGLNTQILISQYLYLLSEKKYDEIIERTNALKVYNYRYLKRKNNEDQKRTFTFINALIILSNNTFNKTIAIKKTKQVIKELKKDTGKYTDISKTLEIIPYERLWKLILETF